MARIPQGGRFGLVVLLVVLAVVLWLAARNLQSVLRSSSTLPGAAESRRDGAPGADPAPGRRPLESSVQQMKTKTGAHTEGVQKALQEAE